MKKSVDARAGKKTRNLNVYVYMSGTHGQNATAL